MSEPKNAHKHYGKCRSCNADIYWATYGERPHPMDRTPVANGRFVLTLKANGTLLAERFDVNAHPTRNLYASHFGTCPNADIHRKGHR